jgi:hypothetical protein
VSSFLHVCFMANMKYPKGSGLLCILLQPWVSKLDEHGTPAARSKKNQSSKEDKSGRSYKKVLKSMRRPSSSCWENKKWRIGVWPQFSEYLLTFCSAFYLLLFFYKQKNPDCWVNWN